MQCDQIIDVVLASGRVIVLTLGMISGIFTIYLGWKLYKESIVSPTTGEFNFRSVKIALTGGGPGVFLAIFGSYLLVSIVGQKLDLSVSGGSAAALEKQNPSIVSEVFSDGLGTATPIRYAVLTPELPEGAKCAIVVRKRMLFSGGEAVTPSEIHSALELSISNLDAQLEAAPLSKKSEYHAAIKVLEDLQEGVVK